MIHALLEVLHHSGISAAARLLPSRHLVVLNFHRVRDEPSEFHDGLIEVGSKQFREHLTWLGRRVDFLSEADLDGLRPGGRPKALITFDDGYRDVYDVAAPILRELGVPAIFFVAPGLVDRRQLGAWDWIAYLVKKHPGPAFQFRGRGYSLVRGTHDAYVELARICHDAIPDRGEFFARELAAAIGVPDPAVEAQSAELLTWDQIRTLSSQGFAIGCHSNSHRVLSSLTFREQEIEIQIARDRLAAERVPAESFSYPFGDPYSYSWETRELVLRAGFRNIFSFGGRVPRIARLDRTRIDRVHFKSTLPKYDFLFSFPALHNIAERFRAEHSE